MRSYFLKRRRFNRLVDGPILSTPVVDLPESCSSLFGFLPFSGFYACYGHSPRLDPTSTLSADTHPSLLTDLYGRRVSFSFSFPLISTIHPFSFPISLICIFICPFLSFYPSSIPAHSHPHIPHLLSLSLSALRAFLSSPLYLSSHLSRCSHCSVYYN